MVIMNVKLDNFLVFKDFELTMTYPKKIVGSTIPEEHLLERPNFRYKKLLVLMGANATGKTALGKILMAIFTFITNKEHKVITDLIEDRKEIASFRVDLAFSSNILVRVDGQFEAPSENGYRADDINIRVLSEKIRERDSYETCVSRLERQPLGELQNYILELEKIPHLSWDFEYPFASEGKQRAVKPLDQPLFVNVLEKTLQALDPRIQSVAAVPGTDYTYVINRLHDSVLIKDGFVLAPGKISSGTAEGIGIADMVTGMKLGAFEFYYCDEKFSHIHTDPEKAFLSLFIELLGPNTQLIYTSHNSDILDMNLPKHSFAFLRREETTEGGEGNIVCVYASDYLKKGTDSLKKAVENDLFSSSPNLDRIYQLEEI